MKGVRACERAEAAPAVAERVRKMRRKAGAFFFSPLHLCVRGLFAGITSEIIAAQQMPAPNNSEKPP